MPPLSQSARNGRPEQDGVPFFLYVEGPRDRDILRVWAQRFSQPVARAVRQAVILGGRQPHRAAEHLRSVRAASATARGLCVLDRDDARGPDACAAEPGLEIYTWGRRHIESYLLVPDALRRTVHTRKELFRLDRALRDHLPEPDDERAYRAMDAKRLLARDGAVSRAVGRTIPAGRIARAMRRGELHDDVHGLLHRIHAALAGLVHPADRGLTGG